ncbi:tetratricopeptide repeat protein [Cystobacter fuscus]
MRLVLLLWTALLLTPLAAHAKGPSAKELVKQAERLYEQKKYVEAAEALEKANEQAPDSRLIYNIARAYDQAGRAREAIGYYEQYMTDGEDAQLRKRARSAVDRLRLQQQKEEAAAAAAEAERKHMQEEAEAAQRRMEAEREAARQTEAANQLRLEEAHRDALAERKRTQITSFALGARRWRAPAWASPSGCRRPTPARTSTPPRTWTPSSPRAPPPGATRCWRTSAMGWASSAPWRPCCSIPGSPRPWRDTPG